MKPNSDLVALLAAQGFVPSARLRPRTAREIRASPWSIGCETIDRDYVDFAHTAPHLSELGATQARVQAGWAKCDPVPGAPLRWEWLDAVVDVCLAQGVRPWLQTSYGNPAYPGGGGIGLADGLPTSPEALTAWDRWVDAMVQRYSGRVQAWEIWNEPDIHNAMTPDEYVAFFIRTATIVRRVDPKARIIGLALAGSMEFATTFFTTLHASGHADLLDELSFHFYPHNPDDSFPCVDNLKDLIRQYAPQATLRQGETGAPSETRKFMALGGFEWSERKQAAWDLRRLLAHHAHGIPMSLFQLADMQYTKAQGAKFEGRNSKGLLCINADKTVAYRKPSYFMAQHVFSLFDSRFAMQSLAALKTSVDFRTSAYAWTPIGAVAPALVGWWNASDAPSLETPPLGRLGLPPHRFRDPVLLDFLSGTVFTLPHTTTPDALWASLPCTDVPIAIVERDLLTLTDATAHVPPHGGRRAGAAASDTHRDGMRPEP